jgi:hypothetical protein
MITRSVCFWRDSPQWVRSSSCTRSLDHTQRRTTVGRIPLGECSARRRDLYLTTLTKLQTDKHPCPRWDSNPQSQQASGRKPTPLTARPLGPAQGVLRTLIFVTSGGINYIFCASIYILFVFLYDTLMKVAEATETCL